MNTWHFQSDAVDPLTDVASAWAELQVFYAAIESVLSSNLTGTITSKWYDLTDGEPRTPIFEDDFTVTIDSANAIPNEVAICLSYRGAFLSGTSPARRRGRIFIGPLLGGVVDQGNGDCFVQSGTMSLIGGAADALATAGEGETWAWAVFSPTTAGPPPWSFGDLAVATFPVIAGYVDNAFDTIRSRGAAASTRFSFTV